MRASDKRRRWAAVVAFSAASRARSRRGSALLLLIFLLPVAIMGIIGLALGGYTSDVLTVGVLDRARTAASAALGRDLEDDPYLRVRAYRDEERMRLSTFRGRLAGALVIPPGWEGEGDLDLYLLEATSGAPVLRSLIDAHLSGERVRAKRAAPVDVSLRVPGGGTEGQLPIGFNYTAPSNLVLFVIINGITSSAGILFLRRKGITRRLLATPASSPELFVALAVGPAQMMALQAAFLIAIAWLGFGVDWGAPLAVFLVTAGLVGLGVSLALCMATVFRTIEQAIALGPLVGIVLGMLGGCMWPLAVVPAPMRGFGRLFPTAWAMDAYLALGFGEVGVRQILPNVAMLWATALALGAFGLVRLRREFAR